MAAESSARCPECFERVTLREHVLAQLNDPTRHVTVVCASCGERLRLTDRQGHLSSAAPWSDDRRAAHTPGGHDLAV